MVTGARDLGRKRSLVDMQVSRPPSCAICILQVRAGRCALDAAIGLSTCTSTPGSRAKLGDIERVSVLKHLDGILQIWAVARKPALNLRPGVALHIGRPKRGALVQDAPLNLATSEV